MKSKLGVIGIFAAGAALGVVAGVLYAPRAGRHTRLRLRNSAERALHRAEEMRDNLRVCLSETADETSEVIATAIGGGEGLTRPFNRGYP